jgi:4-hydroxy-2-oxoheptanedioate aldolase
MTSLTNPVRTELSAGRMSIGIGIRGVRGIEVARIMKSAGFDWLFIDLEHGPASIETVFSISVAALDAGIAPLVRVPAGELVLAARCLDSGALGVVMSHVQSADEARAIVDALRFPPIGHRSVGGSYAQLGFRGGSAKDVIPVLEQATMIVATLETPEGIANAGAIAAVPGIDVLLIGANDLSVEMGIPGQFGHERIAAAVQTVVKACAENGKFAGLGGVYQPDLLKTFVDQGMRMILCGSDIGLLLAACEERAKFVRSCLT